MLDPSATSTDTRRGATPSTSGAGLRLWASECNRHAARTAARLAELLEPGEAVPSRQVVANWAERHGWHPRADEEMRRLAPALHRRLTAQLFAHRPPGRSRPSTGSTGATPSWRRCPTP
jgi:hypothetical protein